MSSSDETDIDQDVRDYFTGLAGGYAVYRSNYPLEIADKALDGLDDPVRALDIGCGTGFCTRLLAEAGAQVIGIDPNEDMLAQARQESPQAASIIEYRIGEAEHLPFADNSTDLILCAQSFHWFDEKPALAEFNRVLSPGGRLALLWNVRQKSNAFTRGYNEIARQAQDDAGARGRLVRRNRGHHIDSPALFTNVRQVALDNPHRFDWPGLLGRARSASYFPRSGPVNRELEAALRELFDLHNESGFVELMQTAELTLAEVVKQP